MNELFVAILLTAGKEMKGKEAYEAWYQLGLMLPSNFDYMLIFHSNFARKMIDYYLSTLPPTERNKY